jgi:TetR/AcrR family transcriptional regulator|tara:strand:- start:864 stop:1481 length:618 start_codon:yes stop_codon:yes gene_type:complete
VDEQLNDVSKRIVDSALELFATYGYGSVSTTQIAKAAGVAQPHIHYYFRTKDDLWKAASKELRRRVDAANKATEKEFQTGEDDAFSKLKIHCRALHRMHIEVPEIGKIIFLEGQAGGDRLDWLVHDVFRDSYDEMIEWIKGSIKLGKIKPLRPHQILMLLHGAAVTYYNLAPFVRSTFDRDPRDEKNASDFTDAYMKVVFDGLAV